MRCQMRERRESRRFVQVFAIRAPRRCKLSNSAPNKKQLKTQFEEMKSCSVEEENGPSLTLQRLSTLTASLVAHLVQLHLAAENPVDADGVSQNNGHTDQRDGQHDPECFGRGRGIVDGQTVSDFRIAEHQMREHLQAE